MKVDGAIFRDAISLGAFFLEPLWIYSLQLWKIVHLQPAIYKGVFITVILKKKQIKTNDEKGYSVT